MLYATAAVAIFLAFAWPFVVSSDPAGEAFHVVAVATLAAFLAAIAGSLALRR